MPPAKSRKIAIMGFRAVGECLGVAILGVAQVSLLLINCIVYHF